VSKDEWTGLAYLKALFWCSHGKNEKNKWIQQKSNFLLRFKLDNFCMCSSRKIYNYTTIFVQRVTASYFLMSVMVCNTTTIKKDWRVLGINLVTVLKTFRNILKLGQWMENITFQGSMMNFMGHYLIYTCNWLCCCPLRALIDTSFCKYVVISLIIYL
jgi:hypothetical protein